MFTRHRVSSPLKAIVDCIWVSNRETASTHSEHMLPSGKAHLIFALHDSPIRWGNANAHGSWQSWTNGIVHGPQSTYYRTEPKPAGKVIGISFHAGTASAVLGVPLSELQDRHICIDDLWGKHDIELRERLAAARDDRAAIGLLERELMTRIRRPLLIHPAVAQALRVPIEAKRVADIRKRSGYSHRHFIDLFRAHVGLTPKQYCRIRRFSSALALIARGDGKLVEIALACGYADQAHLSREFRELAGVTPTAYSPPTADSEHHHVVSAGKISSRPQARDVRGYRQHSRGPDP